MNLFRRILSVFLILTLFLNQGIFAIPIILAQEEASVSAQTEPAAETTPVPTPSIPTPTSTPTIEVTPTPTMTLTEPEASPSATPTLTPEPTPLPTIVPTPTPNSITQNNSPLNLAGKDKSKHTLKIKDNQVLVKFKSASTDINAFAAKYNLTFKDSLKSANLSALKVNGRLSAEAVVEKLKTDPLVVYAEPNYLKTPALHGSSLNDTHRDLLWALENHAQEVAGTTGVLDADVDGIEAWSVTEGSNSTIVAVLDTGVNYLHPDLAGSMWNGSSCKDELGNALGGCNHGYDFEDEDKTPLPTESFYGIGYSSHGTHIAGTIAATKNNSLGVVGVAPNVKIMALKFGFDTFSEVRAIDFAIQNGAKVINASYGGSFYSQSEREAIERFRDAGGLFVAAAGNYSLNNDVNDFYPSKYPLDNIISVAASDQFDNLADFSNYGITSVDIAAPGVNIYSSGVNFTGVSTYFNDFESTPLGLTPPSGWTVSSGGRWEIVDSLDPTWGKVWYADQRSPYSDNAQSSVTSSAFDISGSSGAYLDFWTSCDTQYDSVGLTYTDFLKLEASKDGGANYEQVYRWDEIALDDDLIESNNLTPPVGFLSFLVPSEYRTNNLKFRFTWVTNDTDNNHLGCLIDDLSLSKTTLDTSENYQFMSGTSMATPHVVGAAALLLSKNPSLSPAQVKNIILATGDEIPSHQGKTLTGQRLNINNALHSLVDPEIIGLLDDPSPKKSKTWNWSSNVIGATFRSSIDQSPTKVFSMGDQYGATSSATISSGTGTYYIHVQAKSPSDVESSVVTASVILDNTAPTAPGVSAPIILPTPTPTPSNPVSGPISGPINYPSDPNTKLFEWTHVTDEVSGVAHYLYELVNTTTGEIVETGATIWESIDSFFTELTEGIWNLLIRAEDNAGNISGVLSLFKTVDTIAPTGSITSPDNDAFYNTAPPFTVDVSDNLTGVESVKFQYKDSGTVTPQGGGGLPDFTDLNTDITSPYQADWTGVTLTTNTRYDLQAVVTDIAGNQQFIFGTSFVYDTSAPAAPIVDQPSPTLLNADTIILTGSAEPSATVKVYQDGEFVVSQDLSQAGLSPQGGGGETEFSITVPLLENQVNNFTVTATDQAGNESTATGVTSITEDSDAPGILSYSLDKNTISPQVSLGINDSASFDLLFSEEVTADFDILDASGNKVKDIYASTVTNPQATWDGTNNSGNQVLDGVYTIRISISDTVGNNLTDVSETITVDNDILSLSPIGNKAVNEQVLLSFTAAATNEEGSVVSYSLTSAPAGASINQATGVFSWTPTEVSGPGSFNATINATSGGVTKSETINITVNEVNLSPVADNKTLTVNQEESGTVTLTATDSDIPVQSLTFAIMTQPTHGIATASGNLLTYTPFNDDYAGTDSLTYRASDGTAASTPATVTITINEVDQVDLAAVTNITPGQDEIKISDLPTSDTAVINIPSGMDNVTLDLTNLDTFVGGNRVVTLPDALTINSATGYGDVVLNLPAGLVITADATDWNGNLTAPTDSSFNFTLPLGANQSISDIAVIEVGLGNVPLSLSSAARLQITGQAGASAGYVRNGIFTEITTVCSLDNQVSVDAQLPVNGDCKTSVGSDLIIWTKHFTQFVAYDVVTTNPPSNPSPSSSSGNSGPKSCDSAKPGSAPRLLSMTTGTNSVTLTWSKASDPVTYYLITYGDGPGKQQFGNPNVGGRNATSYTVSGLSGGTTYYFKVRAGNNCMPGEFSNELSARAGGAKVTIPASGFTTGVLSAKPTVKSAEILGENKADTNSKSESDFSFESDKSADNQAPKSGFFGSIGNFFGGIFKFFGGLFGQ